MAELTEAQKAARTLWSAGDYPSAMHVIASVGPRTVEAAGVSGGDTVLDVACGSGNATIPAAKTGAKTTGLDITPELIEAGKQNAADVGVEIDWVEGDAQDLPFEDGSFDVVTSVFGCMFAPDHRKTAAELVRVLKPGGRMAVAAWRPEGNVGRMFSTIASHMPEPPAGFEPPSLWGKEDHVREIFEGTEIELEFEPTTVEFTADSPDAYLEEMERDLPPIAMARANLKPAKWSALRSDLQTLYAETNESDSAFTAPQEYMIIRGTRAG
jgi:ubiquinone/menaquinone biosynthesis C-methylase UbiE